MLHVFREVLHFPNLCELAGDNFHCSVELDTYWYLMRGSLVIEVTNGLLEDETPITIKGAW